MKRNCNNRFVNQQTYLDTVCRHRCRPSCPPQRPPCDNSHCCLPEFQYSLRTTQGKMTFKWNKCGKSLSIDLHDCHRPQRSKDCKRCDNNGRRSNYDDD